MDGTKCKICFTHQWFIFTKNSGNFFLVKKTKPGERSPRGVWQKTTLFSGFFPDPFPTYLILIDIRHKHLIFIDIDWVTYNQTDGAWAVRDDVSRPQVPYERLISCGWYHIGRRWFSDSLFFYKETFFLIFPVPMWWCCYQVRTVTVQVYANFLKCVEISIFLSTVWN